jgi:hypothetical protein
MLWDQGKVKHPTGRSAAFDSAFWMAEHLGLAIVVGCF